MYPLLGQKTIQYLSIFFYTILNFHHQISTCEIKESMTYESGVGLSLRKFLTAHLCQFPPHYHRTMIHVKTLFTSTWKRQDYI